MYPTRAFPAAVGLPAERKISNLCAFKRRGRSNPTLSAIARWLGSFLKFFPEKCSKSAAARSTRLAAASRLPLKPIKSQP